MDASLALPQAFRFQAQACRAMGAPFWGAMLSAAADALESDGFEPALWSPWDGLDARALLGEAVPLRWLGCLHNSALAGHAPKLAGSLPAPQKPGDESAAFAAARALMRRSPGLFTAFMSHEPQTNETRRSVALLPLFLQVAAETALPLRLFELGASAGLNQTWDRHRYDLGAAGQWGEPSAPLTLSTDWRGGPPHLNTSVRVVSRAACDRRPVEIRDPEARRRLLAYVWPEQFERVERARQAIDAALAADVRVEAMDAAAFVRLRAAPQAGAATIVYHSVMWQYLPQATVQALTAAIKAHGQAATRDAPFAWARMEPAQSGDLATMELRLTLWPSGLDRCLGRANPHAIWVEWDAAD